MRKLEKVPLRGVEQGNESFVPDDDGDYLLCGPCTLSSVALTYGGTGAFVCYDAELIEKSGELYYDETAAHQVFISIPVQVGFYSANGGVMHNLVVRLTGGEHSIIPTANIYFKPLNLKGGK